jgi:hypothetical protein
VPLTISEQRYREIRRRVAEAELQKVVKQTIDEPGEVTFSGVDLLFKHLNALVERSEDHPPRSAKKRP